MMRDDFGEYNNYMKIGINKTREKEYHEFEDTKEVINIRQS